jgi:hypothetical protein
LKGEILSISDHYPIDPEKITMIESLEYQGLGELFPADPFRSDWIFIVTLIPLILLLIAASAEKKSFFNRLTILYNPRYANTAYRNGGAGRQVGIILVTTLSLISLSTTIFFAQSEFNLHPWGLDRIQLWFANFALISGAIVLRYISSIIAGEVSGKRELFREYMFNVGSFYKLYGIVLVGLNFLIPYLTIFPQKILILTALGLLVLTWLFRIGRLISIFLKGGYSLFYLILYLCALEFAPILVFGKYISGTL